MGIPLNPEEFGSSIKRHKPVHWSFFSGGSSRERYDKVHVETWKHGDIAEWCHFTGAMNTTFPALTVILSHGGNVMSRER